MTSTDCGFINSPTGSGADLLTQLGPTLPVDIGFDPKFKATTPINIPKTGIKGVVALVDTGAGECCIDNLLAAQINLPIVDRRLISGSSGKHMTNIYLAQIYVPSLNFVMYGAFAGVDLKSGGQVHLALIGRTFLQNFTMIYEGKTGSVKISN